MDNILLDLYNSSHPTSQPHSIIAKYTWHQKGFFYHYVIIYYSFKIFRRLYTVETLVGGNHPREAKKVPVTGASRLRECKIRSLYGSLEKRGFVKAAVGRAIRLRVCSRERELPLYFRRNLSSRQRRCSVAAF